LWPFGVVRLCTITDEAYGDASVCGVVWLATYQAHVVWVDVCFWHYRDRIAHLRREGGLDERGHGVVAAA
jgi:hypothetical protein